MKVETATTCDFDNRVIPAGKYMTVVTGDNSIPAQGKYHGPQCYHQALKHYEELKKKYG